MYLLEIYLYAQKSIIFFSFPIYGPFLLVLAISQPVKGPQFVTRNFFFHLFYCTNCHFRMIRVRNKGVGIFDQSRSSTSSFFWKGILHFEHHFDNSILLFCSGEGKELKILVLRKPVSQKPTGPQNHVIRLLFYMNAKYMKAYFNYFLHFSFVRCLLCMQ